MKQGKLFNEEQKQLKQKIMEDLIDAFYGNMEKTFSLKTFPDTNKELLQFYADMLASILVMFNRELLSNFIVQFGQSRIAEILMDDLFAEIKRQVKENIKKHMN